MEIPGQRFSKRPQHHFASDNNSPAHPKIMRALMQANWGHTLAYGSDYYTKRAEKALKRVFGRQSEAFFVYTGTGANVLSTMALARPYHAVVCAHSSHLNKYECGGPEKMAGVKLYTTVTQTGKIAPADVAKHMDHTGDQHHNQPKVISITQATDYGVCYTAREIKALSRFARKHDMLLHMDGARIYNACVAQGQTLKQMTTDCGVDVLSLGGTKNGLLGAEAVVFLNGKLATDFPYIRKQGTQLASKMRFLAVQVEALVEGDLWRRNASQANKMAARLAAGLARIPGIRITREVQTNMVYCIIPPKAVRAIWKKYLFYVFDETTSEVRLVTSYDTTEAAVKGFLATTRKAMRKEILC